MPFNNNLNDILKEKNITRKELANSLGLSYATISGWSLGKSIPREPRLKKLADYLDVTVDDLLIDKLKIPSNVKEIQGWTKIPVVGTIACGKPILAEENIENYLSFPTDFLSYRNNLFSLKCKGDSMYPTIKDGSMVIIHQQPTVEDNEIAAVLINDEATLKRVKHTENGDVILIPDNPQYKPIILNKADNNLILGKAVDFFGHF